MVAKPTYRLQVLLQLKERGKRKAEIQLAKALKKLEEEKDKLKELEEERDKIIEAIEKEKLQMRERVAAGDAVMKDPQTHLNFIRKLQEDLEEAEKRIEEQKEAIARAEKQLQRARREYIIACQELNTMEQHKELWQKKVKRELSLAEDKVMNELGNTIHQMNKMR